MTDTDPKQRIIILQLNIEEVNTVISGLQELPAKVCNPLTNKIVKQAQEQLPQDEEQK